MLHRARSAILSRMHLSSIPFTSPVGKLLRLPLRVLPKRAVVPVLQERTAWYDVDCRFLYAWLLAWDLRA